MAVKCKECGKEFKNNKSGQLTKHIIKEHYDLETYYNKFYIKNKNEKYCNRDGCDNKCTFKGYKKGYTKFCSRKCIHLTRKIKRKTIKCKNCGKEIKVKINSNRKYCSTKCANEIINNDPESIKKKQKNMKKTMLEKYGVENISQTKQWKEKTKKAWKNKSKEEIKEIVEKNKQTKKERYGNENYVNVEKNKQTKKERYGNENYNNREKFKETMNEKYGVDYAMQSDKILKKATKTLNNKYNGRGFGSKKINNKIKNTLIKNYGVNHNTEMISVINKIKESWKNKSDKEIKEIVDKRIETSLKKYNKTHPSKSIKVKNKVKETNYEKYGNKYFTKSDYYKKQRFEIRYKRIKQSEYIEPLFTLDEFEGIDKEYKFKCLKCGKEYFNNLSNHNHLPLCPKCFIFDGNRSKIEKEIEYFIKNITDTNIITNKKILSNNKEIDIYIPEYNLGIEIDGLYWHSEINGGKNKNYHLDKTKISNKQGIKLLHIWDYEWIYKRNIVKSIIKNNLNLYDKKIGARKCNIKEVELNDKNNFLEQNHIQGKDNSRIKMGLEYKNELVAIMTFIKSRFDKNVEWEMSRFCNKLNYIIMGGMSKLFKYFVNNYNPKSIITYADKRYFDGQSYKKLNFKFINSTPPNYYYIKSNNIYNRMQFQKYKLKKKLKYFDHNLTEWENMQLNKYDRIWDCGNNKYIWKK